MPETANVAARDRVCRKLRSKGMFIDVEPDPSVPSMDSGTFWCVHSMNCLGPDGKVADRESCRPGRPCFEP
jgi:hypothetical protein